MSAVYRRPAGYCYEMVAHGASTAWMTADDEEWDIVVADADPGERWAGQRIVDGCVCQVFKGTDGVLRAATTASCVREPVRGEGGVR